MLKWCVVASNPAREGVAQAQLKNQRFRVFLPEIKRTVGRKGRKLVRRKPLFPGYLFVQFEDSIARWRAVNGTLGVKHLIMQDEKPAILPIGFVETLESNINEDGTFAQHTCLKPGDNAAIVEGAFANHVGRLLEVDDKGRVAILLELLSSNRRVTTRIENLMPA